jgi:lipopolysaccharide transport system permease protein
LVAASVSATYAVNLAGMAAVLVVLALIDPQLHLSGIPAFLVLMVPHFVLSFAVAAALAALQAFIRDVSHVIGVILSILFYATPIVYPAALVPASIRAVMDWNPHAHFSERFRQALTGGEAFVASDLVLAFACALVALACWLFFRRLSPYFEELV